MPDWQDQLSAAQREAVNREKKQAQERRDAERAERMRADNRRLLAGRLLYAQPEPQIQTREPVNRMAARLLWKAPDFAKLPERTRNDLIMEPPRIKPQDVTDIFRAPPATREKQKHADHRGEQHGVYLILGHAGTRQSFDQSLKFHGGRPARVGCNKSGLTRSLHWRGRKQTVELRHFWWVRCPDGSVESIEWSELRRLFPGETVAMMHQRKRGEKQCAEVGLEVVPNNNEQQEGNNPMAVKGTLGETTVERTDQNFPGAKTATGGSMPANSGIPRDHNLQEYYNINEVAVNILAEINKQPHQVTALARAAIDARNVLDENMKQIGPVMEDFNARVKVALEDVRQSRMAVVGEVAHLLQPLKELRAFLLGKDYEFEIARLKEFCDLCERLAKLKKDGTLDAIADTIIKLAM
jgi:hypothetical protein